MSGWTSHIGNFQLVTDGYLIFSLAEYTKLEFIKEIGWTHMRILEGVGTLVQLSGLIARLCKLVSAKFSDVASESVY